MCSILTSLFHERRAHRMKKLATKLMLLSTATLVMLGSCVEPPEGKSNEGESTSLDTEAKAPTKIKRLKDDIPYLQEGIALNLDAYIGVEYSDGTIDSNYEVKTTSKNVTINGHRVSSTEVGVFYVTITAGGLTTKLELTVLSNDQTKIMTFLEPLETDARNFTVDLLGEDNQGNEKLYRRVVHNANYSVVYNGVDLFAVDEDGDPASVILAKLSDGNGYFGHIEKDANNNPKAVFEPGIQQYYDYYYIVMDLELNAADSTYMSIAGEDVLMMGASFAERLMWSVGLSEAYDNYNRVIPFYGAAYKGYEEVGMPNGNPDIMIFDIYVGTESQNEVYCTIKLSAVGESGFDWMNTAVTDASYIPEKITANEIPVAFQAVNAAGNFTLTMEAWSVGDGDKTEKFVPAEADMSGDACANFLGTCDAVITEKYTSTGIYTEFKGKKLNQTTNGYAPEAEYSLFDISAVWNDSGAAYSTRLTDNEDQTAKVLPARSAISGVTDVFQINEIKSMAANNITAAAANVVNWTGKKTEGTKVTFAGDMGDNDGTSQTNLLAAQIFGLLGGDTYGVLKDWAGTWTKATDGWGDGGKHAYSRSSDYYALTVDTTTNEIEAYLLIYAPFSDIDNNYFMMKFTISDIGTTTFDFSTLAAANENPGMLA